jgi:hypothetical protein
VPFIILLKILTVVIATPIALTMGPGAGLFIGILLSVMIDTLKSIVGTAGITYALQAIFTAKKPSGR